MKRLFINEARVTLAVASEQSEFYGASVELPEELADALLEEQRRKYALSEYLLALREAVRTRTDPTAVTPPKFLVEKKEVPSDAEESETQPKPKGRRKTRVQK